MASTTRTFRFGPGAFESLELRAWTVPTRFGRRHAGDARQLRGRLTGTFSVDDGFGQTRVAIDELANGWSSESDDEARLLTAARGGDEDAAVELAHQLLNWALEDLV